MLQYLSLAVLVGAISAEEILLPNTLCAQRNEYMPKRESCDSYIECRDYVASEMLCPDGLHFNPTAPWPSYPCSYPQDMTCEGRGVPQPAKPTADCPHQYGFYPSPLAGPGNCGQYRMCVEGVAIEMMCSPGLAFNPESARCDWPDLVPSCKAEDFLGFKCPPTPLGENGEPLEIVNYRHESNCYAFYSCEYGRPRLLTCDVGYAFDAALGRCVDAEKANCGPILV